MVSLEERVAGQFAFVDGAIVGPPPHRSGTTRLYLSGAAAVEAGGLLNGTVLEAVQVGGQDVGSASAVKMCVEGWRKGSAALLAAVLAASEGWGGLLSSH